MDPGTQLLRRETSKDKTLGLVKSLGWGPHMTIQVLGWRKQQWEQWHMLAVTAGTQWLWVPVISTTGPREQLCVSGWSLNLESLFMPNPKFVNLECLSAPCDSVWGTRMKAPYTYWVSEPCFIHAHVWNNSIIADSTRMQCKQHNFNSRVRILHYKIWEELI